MRLLNLTVENFGLYRGVHHFDLTTRPTARPARNLVLFKGHNGAGKTTLFQTIPLAFHGPAVLGIRLTRPQYETLLLRMLHRHTQTEAPEAALMVSFEYVRSGVIQHIQVERRWRRSGKKVQETLSVTQDGAPVSATAEDCQGWLNELFPPSLSGLCFFDAERLEEFSNPEHHNQRLGKTIRQLFGLDVVAGLQTDLEKFTFQQGSSKKTERLRADVLELQEVSETLEQQMAGLQEKANHLTAEEKRLLASIAAEQERLQAAGGGYAERQEGWRNRLVQVEKEIGEIHQRVHDLCAGLGAFVPVPRLLVAVREALQHEARVQQRRAAGDVWQAQVEAVKAAFRSPSLWTGIKGVSGAQREKITAGFLELLEQNLNFGASDEPLRHNLSEPDQRQLQDWIQQALNSIPAEAATLHTKLRALRKEEKSLKADLQRVPDETVLLPIHAEIKRVEELVTEVRRRRTVLTEEIGSLRFRLEEQTRKRQKTAEQLLESQSQCHRLLLAERTKQVLQSYQDALTRQRLAALEGALLETFNRLCRKDALLTAVAIDPETYGVHLQNRNQAILGLEELSAGERQLYAFALFWALRQVGNRDLPLVIDTPLARLDETHRLRVIQDYLPQVSQQVVLLVTDAETNEQSTALLERRAARSFRLQFDPEAQATIVTQTGPASGKAAVHVS
ncbi:MAG: DNA sulfur modification protein DndD [Blastocatellia bacterium]|nr:DNA sulfur modification protein DndD [Blastocatellia bacterium]